VVLTDRGRKLLDSNRHQDREAAWQVRDERSSGSREREQAPRQEFYSGIRQPRELPHDAKVYAAYLRAAERLQEQGTRIRRVVLDLEVKRDYQRFLQERNRGRGDSDGRPDRTLDEIRRWAVEHQLPEHDGHVQIPDARIEYEGAKERDVPMQPDAKAALEEQLDDEERLWTQNPQRRREVLAEGCARARIPMLSPHALRHTFGTRWLQAGGDIYKLSKILGHSSVGVTEAHYAHLLKDDLVAASQQVRIPVAPRAEGNVVRMPRRGRGRPA
jgi:integrase